MKIYKTRETVISGLMISIGLILPGIFHLFGGGPVFLPMHIPVLISGFLIEMPYALIVGAATPFLSSVITGMPPVFPVMPVMVVELASYGFFTSMFYGKIKQNIYVSLIFGMISGRILSGAAVWIMANFFAAGLPGPFLFVSGSIVTGLPGIILQLIFIPVIIVVLRKYNVITRD